MAWSSEASSSAGAASSVRDVGGQEDRSLQVQVSPLDGTAAEGKVNLLGVEYQGIVGGVGDRNITELDLTLDVLVGDGNGLNALWREGNGGQMAICEPEGLGFDGNSCHPHPR